jgi:large subunit ribosomal protein L10
MASAKVLEEKKTVVDEITNKIKDSQSVILFTYQGLTVSELSSLRRELKKVDAEVCVYKNTLVKRALDDLKIDLDGFLEGPNAILFGKELLEPIKIISNFAKDHDKLNIRVGIISGDVASLDEIKKYANIPSREGLLTMLAGGMIQYVKDLSISLNLYAEKLEGKEN